MSFKVIWSAEAKESYNRNLEYLDRDWNRQVIRDFVNRVNEAIDKIADNPDLFPVHKAGPAIHKCVVTEQITLYYKQSNNSIIILVTFWNVYQNPKKLKL